MVQLRVELLDVVQGNRPPVLTHHIALAEHPSVGHYGNEREGDGAVELVGREFRDLLQDKVDGGVFRRLDIDLEIEGGQFVEEGARDAQDIRDDGVGREQIDVHLQGVVVAHPPANQIVARYDARADEEVAAGTDKPAVAAHEGRYRVRHHLAQLQPSGLGTLPAMWAEITLEPGAAVKANHLPSLILSSPSNAPLSCRQ